MLAATVTPSGAMDVVELYTSQGCSTCPPADRLLGELAADPSILALSFPIDYWDYLGWKDTNARPEFSHRQRIYARSRGDNAVFTPQMVVNGRQALIGSHGDEVRATLRGLNQAGDTPSVKIGVHIEGDRLVVDLPAAASDTQDHATLWVASYLKPQTVAIGAGENRDQTVVYHNVVDRWQAVAMWEGQPLTVELPLAEITGPNTAGLAVILQDKHDGKLGPIIGADRLALDSGT
jgi:hypothetical protein